MSEGNPFVVSSKALPQSRTLLSALAEVGHDGVLIAAPGPGGRLIIRFASSMLCKRIDQTVSDVVDAEVVNVFGAILGRELERAAMLARERGAMVSERHEIRDLIGTPVNREMVVHSRCLHVLQESEGEFYIFSFMDVSDRHATLGRLRLIEAVFNATHDGIIVTDKSRRIIDVNRVGELPDGPAARIGRRRACAGSRLRGDGSHRIP